MSCLHSAKASTAYRCLTFLQGVDLAQARQQNEQFVDQLLEAASARHVRKWGFDFNRMQPVAASTSGYRFSTVREEELPRFYHQIDCGPAADAEEDGSDAENRKPVPYHPNIALPAVSKKSLSKRPRGAITPRKQASITDFICRRKHTKQAAPISKPFKPLNRLARRFSLEN